jgi:hypothetical protein
MTRRFSALFISLTLHVAAVAVAVSVAPAGWRPRAMAGRAVEKMLAFVVQPAAGAAPNGLNPFDPNDRSIVVEFEDTTVLASPGFTFDVAKVAANPALLFPFLTPGISLEAFRLVPPRADDRLANPLIGTGPETSDPGLSRPPLALDKAALQPLLDRTWSRRDRWNAFQPLVALADEYNPNAGMLPRVLHEYLNQNGLQPFVDTGIRDPRLWAQLGLAADHSRFIEFISRYAAQHPSTQATTELLFLLDEIAQANLDALLTLVHTDPPMELRWTRSQNPDAYTLIVELRRYVDAHLSRRGLTTGEAITSAYEAVRLEILDGVVRTTPSGYRAGDARFLMGTIYWRQGRRSEAVTVWRAIDGRASDIYAVACRELLAAIEPPDVDPGPIDELLDAQRERWRAFSDARLRQFGYRPNVF